jgi:zinc transporter ZupT
LFHAPSGTWRFGIAVLGGYSVCLFSSILFPHGHTHDEPTSPVRMRSNPMLEKDVEKTTTTAIVVPAAPVQEVDYALVLAICLGDFIHNYVDGIVIAYSFLECKSGEGWVIVRKQGL